MLVSARPRRLGGKCDDEGMTWEAAARRAPDNMEPQTQKLLGLPSAHAALRLAVGGGSTVERRSRGSSQYGRMREMVPGGAYPCRSPNLAARGEAHQQHR